MKGIGRKTKIETYYGQPRAPVGIRIRIQDIQLLMENRLNS